MPTFFLNAAEMFDFLMFLEVKKDQYHEIG